MTYTSDKFFDSLGNFMFGTAATAYFGFLFTRISNEAGKSITLAESFFYNGRLFESEGPETIEITHTIDFTAPESFAAYTIAAAAVFFFGRSAQNAYQSVFPGNDKYGLDEIIYHDDTPEVSNPSVQ